MGIGDWRLGIAKYPLPNPHRKKFYFYNSLNTQKLREISDLKLLTFINYSRNS